MPKSIDTPGPAAIISTPTKTTTPATVIEAGLEALKKAQPAAQHAPLRHLQTFSTLLAQSAARVNGNAAASAAVLPLAANFDTWRELLAMQGAIVKRLQQQQQDFMQGLGKLAQSYMLIKRANTMSEHAEQQYNVVAQFNDLLKTQATDLLGLQENIEVNYGYWVSQKVAASSK